MPAVDPHTTSRLYVKYHGPTGSHTMVFHGTTGTTQADLTAAAIEVLDGMAPLTYAGTVFDNADYAAAGSAFSFPVTWTTIASPSGAVWDDADGKGKFLQWGGRGADGVRAKWYLFECPASLKKDMRWNRGESGGIDDVMDLLNANIASIGSISGSTLSIYNYANINLNDHAVHRAR